MGWEELANGDLMASAKSAGFEALLTIDKNIRHEQNLDMLPLPVIVLDSLSNALPKLIPFVPYVESLLMTELQRVLYVLKPDGQINRFGSSKA